MQIGVVCVTLPLFQAIAFLVEPMAFCQKTIIHFTIDRLLDRKADSISEHTARELNQGVANKVAIYLSETGLLLGQNGYLKIAKKNGPK